MIPEQTRRSRLRSGIDRPLGRLHLYPTLRSGQRQRSRLHLATDALPCRAAGRLHERSHFIQEDHGPTLAAIFNSFIESTR